MANDMGYPTVVRPVAMILEDCANILLATKLAKTARAAGLPETAAALMAVSKVYGDTPEETKAAKVAVRDRHLSDIKDRPIRKAAAAMFTATLMSYGSRRKKGPAKSSVTLFSHPAIDSSAAGFG